MLEVARAERVYAAPQQRRWCGYGKPSLRPMASGARLARWNIYPGCNAGYVTCLRRVLGRALRGAGPCSGEGVGGPQLMIASKHSRARALSAMPGNRRRSSTTPDSSPPSRQAWRIAWAASSSTANIARAWTPLPGRGKQTFCDRRAGKVCRTRPASAAGQRHGGCWC